MDNDTRTDSRAAARPRSKRPRGCFERPAGSGIWWICYFDEHGRRHREKIGPKGLAKKTYAKRKTEIAERRFFPEQFRGRPELLAVAIKKYVARRRSTIVAIADFERLGRCWATAPETAGKTTHEVTGALIEQVRERRRAEGTSASTWNKEVSWLRAFYGDLLDTIREHPDR